MSELTPEDKGYSPNPPRECGSKKHGGFYAEHETGAGGMLQPYVHVLGSMVEGDEWINAYITIPPRRDMFGNFAASLALGEFVSNDVPVQFTLPELQDCYTDLRQRVGTTALFDHVGKKYYSPWSMFHEILKHGPSRRIPQSLAEELANMTPLPMLFTHSRMPVFRDDAQRAAAYELCNSIYQVLDDNVQIGATWTNPDWGMLARHEDGWQHYARPTLAVLHALDKEWEKHMTDPVFQRAKEFFEDVRFAEQPFGATWITRVTYVKKVEEDMTAVSEQMAAKGIQTLDLEALEPLETEEEE